MQNTHFSLSTIVSASALNPEIKSEVSNKKSVLAKDNFQVILQKLPRHGIEQNKPRNQNDFSTG